MGWWDSEDNQRRFIASLRLQLGLRELDDLYKFVSSCPFHLFTDQIVRGCRREAWRKHPHEAAPTVPVGASSRLVSSPSLAGLEVRPFSI